MARKNPQKIYPKKKKEVKSYYIRTKSGKLVRVKSHRRKYPVAPKRETPKNERKVEEGNFVKDKEGAIKELACALK